MSPARITLGGAHAFSVKPSFFETVFLRVKIPTTMRLPDSVPDNSSSLLSHSRCLSGNLQGGVKPDLFQAGVELYYDSEKITVPPQASKIEDLVKSDLYTKDGFWVLTDIDFSFLSSKTVRINITLPEYKLSLIDKAAKARGLSRSAFLAECAEHAV